jgi:hypothetical protein
MKNETKHTIYVQHNIAVPASMWVITVSLLDNYNTSNSNQIGIQGKKLNKNEIC